MIYIEVEKEYLNIDQHIIIKKIEVELVETKYKNTTVSLTEQSIIIMDKMKELGIRPSRSWIIRECVNNYLPIILNEFKEFCKSIDISKIPNIRKYMEDNGWIVKGMTGRPNKRIPFGNAFYTEDTNQNTILKWAVK